jgi:uncharacterized protein YqeY
MGIAESIYDELMQAMRDRDKPRLIALRNIRDGLQKAEKAKLEPLTEDEIVQNLARQANRCRDAAEEFKQAKREDMVAKEEAELALILDYLPKQVDRDEVEAAAREIIAQVGAESRSDMGKVMGPLMGCFKGTADGGLVSQVVGELLDGAE